ncbi:hypothetical protein [Rhizobium tibeticum]|nr:hypothetical protein [Rhizobium tibeticum]
MEENPALVEAYARLNIARLERREARDALEWLVDEYRHLWPLAPEELLGAANADKGNRSSDAECDIIGRFMMRDTSVLTKRLAAKFRHANPTACFVVMSPEDAQERLEWARTYVPKGRTEKALAAKRALKERNIVESERQLALAREYHAETARLRIAAGVDQAKRRVSNAETAVINACRELSQAEAFTTEGLRMKAEAIKACGFFDHFKNTGGIMAEIASFVQSVITVAPKLAQAA